jgi:hypothetical protein
VARLVPYAFVLLTALFVGAAAPIPDPVAGTGVHLGVNSCAGSTCHGTASTAKKKTGVVQNEYLIGQRYDKHAHAFTALQGELGRRIAANLGIGPADHADQCLICHADNVPMERRGVQFQIADGVGCEACHGGSEKWLGPHATGKVPHADLVANYGLYPTDKPEQRAQLCLGCHVGDETHVISHKIMGAGHPRMPFELQTFVQIEPAHYVVDAIYRSRKHVSPGVQFWAVGQAQALQHLAAGIAANQKREGAFPELVFFDCNSCHHPTSALRWERRASSGLEPGLPHFNDSNGIMLRVLPGDISPETTRALNTDIRALHIALSEGGGRPSDIASRISAEAGTLAETLEGHEFTAGEMRAMIASLAQAARDGDATDYAAAEQATMAFAAIIDTLNTAHDIDAGTFAALHAGLDRCYAATEKPDHYDPHVFAAAAQTVAQAW